jgi:hypothetical protein
MSLLYYQKEKEQFSDQDKTTLTNQEALYIFKRLRKHYKFFQRFEIWGHGGGGHCNTFRVQVSNNTSIRTFVHEVAHAIQFKTHQHGKKWHTKKHKSIMVRVMRYALAHLDGWKAQVAKNCDREAKTSMNRYEKKQKVIAERSTPEWKLKHLQELEKRAESKVRRDTKHLKKIQRRIRIWERKSSPVYFISAGT